MNKQSNYKKGKKVNNPLNSLEKYNEINTK